MNASSRGQASDCQSAADPSPAQPPPKCRALISAPLPSAFSTLPFSAHLAAILAAWVRQRHKAKPGKHASLIITASRPLASLHIVVLVTDLGSAYYGLLCKGLTNKYFACLPNVVPEDSHCHNSALPHLLSSPQGSPVSACHDDTSKQIFEESSHSTAPVSQSTGQWLGRSFPSLRERIPCLLLPT